MPLGSELTGEERKSALRENDWMKPDEFDSSRFVRHQGDVLSLIGFYVPIEICASDAKAKDPDAIRVESDSPFASWNFAAHHCPWSGVVLKISPSGEQVCIGDYRETSD